MTPSKNAASQIRVQFFESLGQTVQFLDLRDNLVREGMSSNSANVQIQVSPLLVKIARGRYRLVVDPRQIDWRLLSDDNEGRDGGGGSKNATIRMRVGARELLTGNIGADIPDAKWSIVLADDDNLLECESRNGKLFGLKPLFKSLRIAVGDTIELALDFEDWRVSVVSL